MFAQFHSIAVDAIAKKVKIDVLTPRFWNKNLIILLIRAKKIHRFWSSEYVQENLFSITPLARDGLMLQPGVCSKLR
jgi:hypothetical protein